jgi:hypothetical protein
MPKKITIIPTLPVTHKQFFKYLGVAVNYKNLKSFAIP